MGLDMYLHAEVYTSAHFSPDVNAALADVVSTFKLPQEPGNGLVLRLTVAYWRKANAVHGWFVDEVQGGVDECQRAPVSIEQLRTLRETCARSLATKTVLLQPREGFFFGGTEVDDYYWSDLLETVRQLDALFASPMLDQLELYYQSAGDDREYSRMMPWTCDSLLPIAERYASGKFRRLSRGLNPFHAHHTRAELVEVRALQLTPGMTREAIDVLMLWDRNVVPRLRVLAELDAEAEPLARANAEGATEADGEAMLRAMLEHRPSFARHVPLYVTRYLQRQRHLGFTAEQLAHHHGTTAARVRRWWRQDTFDPFTGLPRPDTHRGQPVHRHNWGVLGI